MIYFDAMTVAIDHRTWKTALPVRSAVLKPCAGRLVVGWVTTSEYLLLIVFTIVFFFWGGLCSYFWDLAGLIVVLGLPLRLLFFCFWI
jgi:hypothetical protein